MKQKYGEPKDAEVNGPWQYYIDSYFAWIPNYCQGTLCWLQRVWFTWPEDKNGNLIMASDILPDQYKKGSPNDQEMYRNYYPNDPREK